MDFDYLFERSGLDHVSVMIFQCLDVQSLIYCRQVSKRWRDFFDKQIFNWRLILKEISKCKTKKRYDPGIIYPQKPIDYYKNSVYYQEYFNIVKKSSIRAEVSSISI